MATTPFTLSGSLRYPPDDGEPDADRPFSLQDSFTHESNHTLNLVGAGTKVVDFGTLTALGAKCVAIEVLPAVAGAVVAPVNVIFNGGVDPIEISQGGFIVLGSPKPVAGVLGLSVVHTQNACVKIRLLG